MKKSTLYICTALLAATCTGKPGNDAVSSGCDPVIFPDYSGVLLPRNIAPANFMIDNEADAYYTILSNGEASVGIKGKKVGIRMKDWHRLTQGQDSSIGVQVFLKKDGRWSAANPFDIYLSDDLIDRYITYRRIPVAVESYEVLDMCQRDITDFKEVIFFSNTMVQNNESGTCVNCHHCGNYSNSKMQFHVRQYKGGTVLAINGELRKVNMKTDSTMSAGVYPAWHPTHDYIAYSNNKTHQSVHAMSHDKLEVIDEENDIILYNINENAVSPIETDSSELECFPAWSADGRTLYYVSAHYEAPFGPDRKSRIFLDRKNLHFNLYAKPFDPDTRTWGPHYLVYDAEEAGSSMTWPRLSPDGRYMMTCISTHGIFPIDQIASDLFIFDFSKGTARRATEINSQYAESYHVWSSNAKWIMWSTRREDGVHTRLYFSHIDENGNFSKPFALPQKDPEFNRSNLYAFNIPEFMVEPVNISAREFAEFIAGNDAVPAAFESKRETDKDGVLITTDYRVDGTTSASAVGNGSTTEEMYLH
ncbi:MAG: hypothetical protein MJY75_02410 [Bacteroidaceae bacterium]|nr:hypothetical protein [Bacteroidaceae bacterium]